jgi:hypothetical protein
VPVKGKVDEEKKKEEINSDPQRAADVINDFDPEAAIFERAIIMIPYKSPDLLKRI